MHEAVEEQLRLAAHRLGEVLVEVRIEVRIRVDLLDVLQAQPLRGEALASAGARIGEHAARLLSRPAGVDSSRRPRGGDELLVGRHAPEEERQPRCEIDVGDAIGAARRASVGACSRRKTKYGLARIASSAVRTPARSRPSPRLLRRTASGARPQRRSADGDRPRRRGWRRSAGARALVAGEVGRQREDLLPARRVETPVVLIGPWTTRSRMCGSVVMPAAGAAAAYDHRAARSGPRTARRSCATNAAATLCWPAFTRIGSVRSGVWPRPSAPAMLISSRTRAAPRARRRSRCRCPRSACSRPS